MIRFRFGWLALAFAASIVPGWSAAGDYSVLIQVVEGHTTYHLRDASRHMDVGIVPDIGNFVYEFKVNGKDVLITPTSLAAYARDRKFCCGIPFLAPWANRIAGDAYYFQGKKYLLNPDLGNFQRDQFGQPIHGLVEFDGRWKVVTANASDVEGATLTSELEFYAYPDLMAQFPFAHRIRVTYRLEDGALQNTTTIENVGLELMPVLIAYHPYFRPDGERAEWVVSNAARNYWVLNDHLTPTGETKPSEDLMPGRMSFLLGKHFLDNLFSYLDRGADGMARVSVKGQKGKIEVVYGQSYNFAVIYAPLPPSSPLVCIEPQTGPTNAFNLNHEGKYSALIVLEPGKTFSAEFSIVPTGF
jgi:aldose 1-epimerase